MNKNAWKISLIGLVFFIFGFVFYNQYKLIKNIQVNLWSELPEADCGVVLTGAPGRIREGFEILQQKKIKWLIISGVYKETTFKEIFPYWIYYPEIDSRFVILEKRSQTTLGNAHQSLALVETLRCQDILLITSQLHMNRALKVFESIYPDDIMIKEVVLPNSKNEQGFVYLLIEIVKSFFYTALGLVNYLGL